MTNPRGSRLRHGMSHTSTYWAWSNMIRRCTDPTNSHWRRYGGRGIKVCKRWMVFDNFLADMGPRPAGKRGGRPLYTIDRKNNDGDYEPGNCRWATTEEQTANRPPRDYAFAKTPEYRRKMSEAANRRWRKSKGNDDAV